MNRAVDPAKLDLQYRTSLILWFAFLSSIGIYVFLSFVIQRQEGPENRLLAIVFTALSLFLLGVSFVVKKKFLARSVAAQDVRLVNTGFVLAAALCEAAALFGLLDFLVAQDRYYFFLIALSFFGLLLHFPRRSHLEAAGFKSNHTLT